MPSTLISRRALLALTILFGMGSAQAKDGADPAREALATGGAVALIRHATAPGTGDPAGFRLGDCTTQRNLSEGGRRQAAELGTKLRAAGIRVAEVRSSRWCRALDTATLAFPELTVTPEPVLDSFFAERGGGEEQTKRARSLIEGWRGKAETLVLVTHQVNITALTNIFPAEGEIVVVRPRAGGFNVVGRTRP